MSFKRASTASVLVLGLLPLCACGGAPGSSGSEATGPTTQVSDAVSVTSCTGALFAATSTPPMPSAQYMVQGDFNFDGTLDIASAPPGEYLNVNLGNGDGTFGPTTSYDQGFNKNILGLAVGDLTGDGILDLAIGVSGGVLVLAGYGNGSFASPVRHSGFRGVESLVTGDFNRDGILDVAAGLGPGGVNIMLGTGGGGFGGVVNVPAVPGYVRNIVAVDLNFDGILDLVTADGGRGVTTASVLLGNGDGSFGAPMSYSGGKDVIGVAVADFTGDGVPDIATANNKSSSVSLLAGYGSGSFAPAVSIHVGVYPQDLRAGDFNGDGRADLAVATFPGTGGDVQILLGNGNGTFAKQGIYTTGSGLSTLLVGDYNGDGRVDVLGSAPTMLLNQGCQ